MAMKTVHSKQQTVKNSRGFALLIAVIFMSVMLTFGIALGSLGYKQQVLASSAIASQYAFYVADAALECALYADQRDNIFAYNRDSVSTPLFLCDNNEPDLFTRTFRDDIGGTSIEVFQYRLSLDSGKHCADVTVYKYSAAQPPNNLTTYLFSQGYDVSCATVTNPPDGARFASRGLSAYY